MLLLRKDTTITNKISEENNPKAFYKYANSNRKVQVGISNLKKTNGGFTENDKEKAEELNSFFKSVFVVEDLENIPDANDKSNGLNIGEMLIDENKVMNLLENLNTLKSYGPDLIHPRILIECRSNLVIPLTMIFKLSYEIETVVEDWKTAHVKALFKKGARDEAGNHRPISLTCIPCKMMEKLVRDCKVSYMNSNNMFSNSQFGFRSLRSCALQLLDVMEKWTKWIDEGNSFDCIYYDFSKAFDTVPHTRLMKKLESYGINGKILNWVKAFLTNRKQQVIVNKSESDWCNITSGIPQGGV